MSTNASAVFPKGANMHVVLIVMALYIFIAIGAICLAWWLIALLVRIFQ